MARTRRLAAVAAMLALVAFPSLRLTPTAAAAVKVRNASVGLRVASLNSNFLVSDEKVRSQLATVDEQDADVVLLQEVRQRLGLVRPWARRHGYSLYAPGRGDSARHESVVLLRRKRFRTVDRYLRLGSAPLRRESGGTIGARYLTNVIARDRWSGRRFAFTSTHAVPQVQTWSPDPVRPRRGTQTLRGFRAHVRAVRAQARANRKDRALTVLGGDFNAGQQYEHRWKGFQTDVFGHLLRSTHDRLGRLDTFVDGNGLNRTIDYVYSDASRRVLAPRAHLALDVSSDHHLIVADFRVRGRR